MEIRFRPLHYVPRLTVLLAILRGLAAHNLHGSDNETSGLVEWMCSWCVADSC
jgi:hypothetical protein